MKLAQIKKIVARGESGTVEFKTSTGQLRSAFETVCAFLNEKGGTVFIGIADDGRIIGQEVSDKTRQEIAGAILNLEPPAQSQIAISYVPIDDKKQIIVIRVGVGSHVPYVFDGRSFHRVQSTSPRMPQHRYEQLIVQRGQLNHSWDERGAIGSGLKKLNHDLILSIVNDAANNKKLPRSAAKESTVKILERFGLIKNSQILNGTVASRNFKM